MFQLSQEPDGMEFVNTRISISVDSTYRVVMSSLIEEQNELMVQVPISIQESSFIDGKDTITYQLNREDLTDEQFEQVNQDPTKLIFTSEKKLLRRPSLDIHPCDETQIIKKSRDGTPVFQVGVPINMQVSYLDPDNIGFDSVFTKIKMKDRSDFVQVPSLFSLDPETKTFNFVVQSAFPGVATIRAKDMEFLCSFEPYQMRFMP